MCRVYCSRSGWYVRLCYVHGARRGDHVQVPRGYVLDGRHYRRGGPMRAPKQRRFARRCWRCGGPLSRHAEAQTCQSCKTELERGDDPRII